MNYVGLFDTMQQSYADEGRRSCCPACRCWLIGAHEIKSLALLNQVEASRALSFVLHEQHRRRALLARYRNAPHRIG